MDKTRFPKGRVWVALPSDPDAPMKYTTKDKQVIALVDGSTVPARGNATGAWWVYVPENFKPGRYKQVGRWGSPLGDWNQQTDFVVIRPGGPTPPPPTDGAELFFVIVAGRMNKGPTFYQNQPDSPLPTFYLNMVKEGGGAPLDMGEPEPIVVTATASASARAAQALGLGPRAGGSTPLN